MNGEVEIGGLGVSAALPSGRPAERLDVTKSSAIKAMLPALAGDERLIAIPGRLTATSDYRMTFNVLFQRVLVKKLRKTSQNCITLSERPVCRYSSRGVS